MFEAYVWSVLAFNAMSAIGSALLLHDKPRHNPWTMAGLSTSLGFVAWSIFLLWALRS